MVIKLLRRATGSWTLERKSILFFGTTLLVSVTISSWVMHGVTQRLVMQTTRQIAHDYAMLQVYNVHMINFDTREPRQTLQGENFNAEVRKNLYETLIFNPRYKSRVMSLDMASTHSLLPMVSVNQLPAKNANCSWVSSQSFVGWKLNGWPSAPQPLLPPAHRSP